MNEDRQPPPRQIYRLTMTMDNGIRYWRHLRCPHGGTLDDRAELLSEGPLSGVVERERPVG